TPLIPSVTKQFFKVEKYVPSTLKQKKATTRVPIAIGTNCAAPPERSERYVVNNKKRGLLFSNPLSKKGGDTIRRGGELRRSYEKRKPVFFKTGFTKKKAATYSPTLICSTICAIGLNFSVRNGKR